MVGLYLRLHSWNRIMLVTCLATLALMMFLGTLTSERMLVMPVVAAFMWACGWATIGGCRLVRKQRR